MIKKSIKKIIKIKQKQRKKPKKENENNDDDAIQIINYKIINSEKNFLNEIKGEEKNGKKPQLHEP
jgi:hypothetical protein